MKRALSILAISMIVLLSLAAKAQSGATTGTITDNSLIFKGYYQGSTQPSGGGQGSDDKSITLTFYNKDGVAINHNHQTEWGGSEGTVVEAKGSSYQDSNTDTIFRWTMEGTTTSEVTLRFTFSTMQAQVNGKYFRPTYIIKMTQNQSKKNTTTYSYNNNYSSTPSSTNTTAANYTNDPFYSSGERTIVSVTKGSNNSEYLDPFSISYSGTASGTSITTENYWDNSSGSWKQQKRPKKTISWYRSGSCTLNISDYEKDKPGDYVYSCWVIAEVTVK
ncbi:MAG TPA: hypothetical protein DCP98_04085 [Sphaerochaeta sp.]|nr:hypothetical protein [Sphaerochaeta sp.]